MADSDNKTPALTDKIDELESLLTAQRNSPGVVRQDGTAIPILDELITDEEDEDYPELPFEEEPDPRLEQIADELEHKLSQELDEIVNLLKTNMRKSIINELQTLLHNDEPDKKTDN